MLAWTPLRTIGAALAILCSTIPILLGWGTPQHMGIVDSALSVIPSTDGLIDRLQENAYRLRVYVLLGDWPDSYVAMSEQWTSTNVELSSPGVAFYANDYLLFPASPRLRQHGVPEVLLTYRPFFDRALQALRAESPANAARWIGSLLHYVTDTGSPPHAAGISGAAHTKMENWLDASRIDISDYRPKLLGASDAEAREGFLRRMDELIAFSKLRAERLRPLVARDDRQACEPIALESATETAKVAADVLHTLLQLADHAVAGAQPGADLDAEVTVPDVAGMELLPVKLILLGTNFSTLSDTVASRSGVYQGRLQLRHLPPGTYQPVLSRSAAATLKPDPITVQSGQRVHLRWDLGPSAVPGNLIRNPDFQIRWIRTGAPDGWQYDAPNGYWRSDNIKVVPGATYRISIQVDGSAAKDVFAQWMAEHWLALGSPAELDLAPSGKFSTAAVVAPPKARYLKVGIRGPEDPRVRIAAIYVNKE